MSITNLKIGTRLGVGFSAVIFIFIIICIIAITHLKSGSNNADIIVNNRYAKIALINQVKNNVDIEARDLRNALLLNNFEQARTYIESAENAAKKNAEIISELEKTINLPKGKEIIESLSGARAEYHTTLERTIKHIENNEREQAIDLLFKEVIPAQNVYFSNLDKLADFEAHLMETSAQETFDQANSAITEVIVLSISAVILASVLGFFITRSITVPITRAIKVAEIVAAGDLTNQIEITSTDETGQLLQALKDMSNALQEIVGQVLSGTKIIDAASTEITAGNMDLSSRTEQQASSLEETASSMEEITATVQQNAENARQADNLAKKASEVASKGGDVVLEVVGTMSSISDSAKKIVDIISVIDGIAFQTNILALNAAVEAARAGEQGRGFAVVASEVRNLAQRSASAAKEIKTLISDSVEKVEAGSRLVDLAGSTMLEVVESVKHVSDVISEITSAGHEQTTGVEQVNFAISEIDNVTQKNAALVEEAAAAASSLKDQATHLAQVVSIFKIERTISPPTLQHNLPDRENNDQV